MDQATPGNTGAPAGGQMPPATPPAGPPHDNAFWKFQGNQLILLVLFGVAVKIVDYFLIFIPIIGWLAIIALNIFSLVLFIIWLINVIGKKMKPLPVIGTLYTFIK